MIPHTTAFAVVSPRGPSAPSSPGARFCCAAPVASAYWGRDQTMFAAREARAHPHPSTGLTCLQIAPNGRSPVDRTTYPIADSITMPSAIMNGCNHSMLTPARTPR